MWRLKSVMRTRGSHIMVGGLTAFAVADITGGLGLWTDGQMRRATNALRKRLLSPELDDALTAISGVYNDLSRSISGDKRKDRFPVLLNLLILNTIHEKEAATQLFPDLLHTDKDRKKGPVDPAAVLQGGYFVRFATSSYGVLMLKGLNIMAKDVGWPPVTLDRQQLDRWCITRHTKIKEEDLVKVSMFERKDLHFPAYYIAVDHHSKSVVLSIRGTFGIQDTITDLVCDSTEYLDGFAHHGMEQSVATMMQDCRQDLVDQLEAHKGYQLVLTGHSLGAGTAILMTMQLLQKGKELGFHRTPIKCYAYAPPPVFSPLEKTPRGTNKHIQSFIFRHDIAPRLSLGSVYNMVRLLQDIDEIPANWAQRVSYLVREMKPEITFQDNMVGPLVGFNLGFRYSTKIGNALARKRKRSDSDSDGLSGAKDQKETNPIDLFVERYLAENIGAAWGAQVQGRRISQGAVSQPAVPKPANQKEVGDFKRIETPHGVYQNLQVPGQLYWMNRPRALFRQGEGMHMANSKSHGGQEGLERVQKGRYTIQHAEPTDFNKMLLVDTAVVDHWPNSYELCFRELAAGSYEIVHKDDS